MPMNLLRKRDPASSSRPGHKSAKSADDRKKVPHESQTSSAKSKPAETGPRPPSSAKTKTQDAKPDSNGESLAVVDNPVGNLGRSATIRNVPSFEGSESSPESKRSDLSSSLTSTGSALSTMGTSHLEKPAPPAVVTEKSESAFDTPSKWGAGGVRVIEPSPVEETTTIPENTERDGTQWDSTIGKAGLGKTGRVINKLVGDNEALKRDLQIERLKAEESKQAAKLVEDKMERVVSDYESRLLEANVTKTLLARKERQVETLTTTVEQERNKTKCALEREAKSKDELEKTKTESQAQIDKANTYAQLMEGRYSAISSHWKEQGDEVKRAVGKMKAEVYHIVQEREKDDDKIRSLRDLCDQQNSNIAQLRKDRDDIAQKFEEYKELQEKELYDLKYKGKARDAEQDKLLKDSKDALDKLRWALNVKQNVAGAQ